MLIPYNVDRPARRLPVVTYSLMGINIFLFLVTVFISNVNLPADRQYGRQAAAEILNDPKNTQAKEAIAAAAELDPALKDSEITFKEEAEAEESGGAASRINPFSKQGQKAMARQKLWQTAVQLAYEKANTEEGYQRAWQIEYMDSSYVLTPHYSALQLFAYRPGEESIIGKLMGLIGSMFLHGDFMHILGNMFFLWIFGRATEDSLGPRVYLGAYLLCGVAATLLHHIMTMQFAPAYAMGIPALGASGAIAGVMGLFAPRFYRTPVRVFYLLPPAIAVFFVAFLVLFLIMALIFGDPIAAAVLSVGAILVGFYYLGRTWAWGAFKAPAAAFLAFYVGYQDVYPIVRSMAFGGETGDGIAHWAHIGGFLFGMLYAFLIGAQNEGKQEFLLEDAEKAYNLGDMAGAVSYAQNVLEREPGTPGAYEVLAKAYMKQNNENDALDNFELAIENYLRVGERGKAASSYLMALEKFPRFILQPATQLAIGNQMAKNYSFKEAAETLVKIPYTFPDAAEGEVALLRSSQIYLQYLNQPQTTVQLLQFFLQKYPESQWLPQVERAWKMAHHQLMVPQQPEVVEEPEPEVPQEPVKIRPQAVAPVLELDDGAAGAPGGPSFSSPAAPPPGARTQQMPPRPPAA